MGAFQALKIGRGLLAWSLLICCLAFTSPASAQYYVGGSFGQSHFSGDVGAGLITSGSTETQHTAFKVFGGYVFKNPHFSAELAYVDLGKLHFSGDFEGVPNEGRVKFSGFNFSAVGSLRVASSSLFAKAGVFAWSAETSSIPGSIFPGVKNGQDLSVGLGASVDLSPAWSVRGEWERFKLDVANARLLTLGVAYRF